MNIEHKVVQRWSVQLADWTYSVYRMTHWGDCTTAQQVATGDREWALRNAEHFGVEIEDDKFVGIDVIIEP